MLAYDHDRFDDALAAFLDSDMAVDMADAELTHSHLETLMRSDFRWRPTVKTLDGRTPRGFVTWWLMTKGIPLHPRTRKVKVRDLVQALDDGKIQPTSAQEIAHRANDARLRLPQQIRELKRALDRVEMQIRAIDAQRDRLIEQGEALESQLVEAEAQEQRLYESGDLLNTIPRVMSPTGEVLKT